MERIRKTVTKMKHRKSLLVVMIAMMALYSCVPTREVRDENVAVPENYQNQSTDTVNTGLVEWRTFFKDPNLIALIDSALAKTKS